MAGLFEGGNEPPDSLKLGLGLPGVKNENQDIFPEKQDFLQKAGHKNHQRASVTAGGYAASLSLLHDGAHFVTLLALYPFQRMLTTTGPVKKLEDGPEEKFADNQGDLCCIAWELRCTFRERIIYDSAQQECQSGNMPLTGQCTQGHTSETQSASVLPLTQSVLGGTGNKCSLTGFLIKDTGQKR
ncbi:hypothetical protein ANN_10189 [Periplaneta americana]|uniref:Uncharacterized protein n=1 Tax=Periplaneta americana TaxID=6978 RepID=A0ABQ8TPX5_PERAM|nr:hypothetical protein ANN_10189 [Periplaneta americana]